MSSAGPLPPPLIPLPKRRSSDCEPAEEEEGREAPTLPQDLGNNISLEIGEPEVAAEAYSEIGGSPVEGEQDDLSDGELDDRGISLMLYKFFSDFFFYYFFAIISLTFASMFPSAVSSPELSLTRHPQSEATQEEEFDSLFDSTVEEPVLSPKVEGPPPLSENDLAVFDPCYKQGGFKQHFLKSYCCQSLPGTI